MTIRDCPIDFLTMVRRRSHEWLDRKEGRLMLGMMYVISIDH